MPPSSGFLKSNPSPCRSPNAEEALCLLSMPTKPTKELVEQACGRLLDMGVGLDGKGSVIIRSGAMGACIGSRGQPYTWVEAFWDENHSDRVVDVTGMYCRRASCSNRSLTTKITSGAGNSFLGGFGAGYVLSSGDVIQGTWTFTHSCSSPTKPDISYAATLYATISASYTIEQAGLPKLTQVQEKHGHMVELWNGDSPQDRLRTLQDRLARQSTK